MFRPAHEEALISNQTPAAYSLIFDLEREDYGDWCFPAFGLLFVAISVAAVLYERWSRPVQSGWRRALAPWACLVFASLWTLALGIATYREHVSLTRALESGSVQYVEGPVEGFVPMPANGHGVEKFEVRGKHFEYADNLVTPGFHTTSARGGPIRPGLQVRVGYVGQTIVRLECQ